MRILIVNTTTDNVVKVFGKNEHRAAIDFINHTTYSIVNEYENNITGDVTIEIKQEY